jgi:hypothetical protein
MLKSVTFSLEDWMLLLENGSLSKSPEKHVSGIAMLIFFLSTLQNLQFFYQQPGIESGFNKYSSEKQKF